MSLDQGSVSVDGSGTVTGSGCTLYVFNQILAIEEPKWHDPNTPSTDWLENGGTALDWFNMVTAQNIKNKQYYALQATYIAGLIPYITANAEITATIPGGQSLQLLPAVLAPGTPTDGTGTDIELEGMLK